MLSVQKKILEEYIEVRVLTNRTVPGPGICMLSGSTGYCIASPGFVALAFLAIPKMRPCASGRLIEFQLGPRARGSGRRSLTKHDHCHSWALAQY